MEIDTIIVTQHDDGTLTADRFPERIAISVALMADADPQYLDIDISYGEFTFRLMMANGIATYEVVGYERPCFIAELQTVVT